MEASFTLHTKPNPMLSLTKQFSTPLIKLPFKPHHIPPRTLKLSPIRTSPGGENNVADDDPPPPPTSSVGIRFRRGSRKRRRQLTEENSGGAAAAKAKSKPKPKDWESMSIGEKTMELYMGEKGLLFWLNKFAYASIFVVIGGWILFRFVGPALNLYQLDSPPLSPQSMLKGSE